MKVLETVDKEYEANAKHFGGPLDATSVEEKKCKK